jgi:hypothetical protein
MNKKQPKQTKQDIFTAILNSLDSSHAMNPRWRIGQIIANAVRLETGRVNCDPFHISDEELLSGIKKTYGPERE